MSIAQILADNAKAPGHLKGRSGCLDWLALLGTAVVVIVIFGGAYWLTLVTGKSPLWVFGAGNAICIAFILLRRFKTLLKLCYFKLYLAAWAVLHGGLAAAVSRLHFNFGVWPIFFVIELTVGYVITVRLFRIERSQVRPRQPQRDNHSSRHAPG